MANLFNKNNDLLDVGQFWLVDEGNIRVAEKTGDSSNETPPYITLNVFRKPDRASLISTDEIFYLEVV